MKNLLFILLVSLSSFTSFGQESISLTPETDSEVIRIISEIEKTKSPKVENLRANSICSGVTCLNYIRLYPKGVDDYGNKEEEKILFAIFVRLPSGSFEIIENINSIKWVPVDYTLNLKNNPEWFEDYKYYIKLKPEKRKIILNDLKEIQKKLKK